MRCPFCPLAAALILGCSSPRAADPQSLAPTAIVPIAPAPEAPPQAPREPPRPAEIREPADVACRIESAEWSSDQLRLRVDGPRFAQLDRAHTNVVVPVTASPREAIAVIDDGRVLVRAVVARDDLRLYAPKPTALLGIVTPAAKTNLIWARSAAGSVRVGVDTTGVLRSPAPFEADVPCADLAIVSATYSARDSITKRTKLTKRDVIRDGAPLAATRDGAPVAELDLNIEVEVVETRGGQARVLADQLTFVLSGWVSQRDLGPPSARGYAMSGAGGGERGYGMSQMHLMHCPGDVGLFVALGSERVKVGLIHKGAGFRVKAKAEGEGEVEEGGFRVIDLPGSPRLIMDPNARLLVEASALPACHQDSPGF